MPSILRYVKILRQHPQKFRFLVSRVLMRTNLSQFFVFQRSSYKLRFYPSALTASLWINSQERLAEETFLRTLIQPGDKIIDVGANIGTVSLAMASQNEGLVSIHAIEPHPKIYSYLKGNIALNKLEKFIKTYCIALGDKSETLHFSDRSDDTNNMLDTFGKLSVPVAPLDDLIHASPTKLLKIDVEGFEYKVLSGAPNTLKQTEIVYLECIPELLHKNNSSEMMICELLEKSGFKVFNATSEGPQDNIIGSHLKKMLLEKRLNR